MKKFNNSYKRHSKGFQQIWVQVARLSLCAILAGVLLLGELNAQQSVVRCRDFDLIMQRIKTNFAEEDYAKVLVQLQAARACDPNWDGLNTWYGQVFNAINKQKETAEREKGNALRARERADSALERAELAALAERKAAEEAEAQRLLAVSLQQMAETRTRTAFANELAFNAKILYKEGQRDKALGLADFAYNYVDSLNPLVQSILFDVFYANIGLDTDRGEGEAAAAPQQMALAWSPDGQYQAIAYNNGELKILNGEGSEYVRELTIPLNETPSLTWSADGAFLAVASDAGEVAIWNTADWSALPGFSLNATIISIAWQPGANVLAIGGQDGYIYLREAFSGQSLLLPLEVHADWIRRVAWSPDGSMLASCSDDGHVAVFQAGNLEPLANYLAHSDWVRDMVWSADNKLISVGDDGRVVLWNPLKRAARDTVGIELATQTDWIMKVDWSDDGDYLVTVDNGGLLSVLDAEDGRLLDTLLITDRMISDLDWQPRGNRIGLAATLPGELSLWADWDGRTLSLQQAEIPQGYVPLKSIQSSIDNTTSILCVDWSANSRHLASGANDGTIRIFHTGQSVEPSVWNSGQEQIVDIGWSKGDRYLATIGTDNTVKVWEATTGEVKAVFRLDRNIRSLDWSPVDFRLAVACDDLFVYVYDIERQRLVLKLAGHTDWVRGVSWSPDGRRLASCSDDRSVKIWDGTNGSLIIEATQHQNYVLDVAWSPKGSRLASCDNAGEVMVWQTDSLRLVHKHSLNSSVMALSWSFDGRYLAAGTMDGDIIQFEDSTKTAISWSREQLADLAYASDNRQLAVAVAGGGPVVLETGKGSVVLFPQWRNYRLPEAEVVNRLDSILNLQLSGFLHGSEGLYYSPDGSMLAYMDGDYKAVIWDIRRDTFLLLEGHLDWVRDIAWSPDSKRIATASDDGRVKVWNPTTGICLWTAPAADQYLFKVSWSPDGRLLAIAENQGKTKLYAKDKTGMGFRLSDSLSISGEPGLLRFSADSRRLLIGTTDSLVAWQLAEKRVLYRHALPTELGNCQLSYDASLLVSLIPGEYPIFWNLDNGKEVYTPVSKRWPCVRVAWANSSLSLALVSTSKQIHLWDASRWRPIATLDKFDKNITALSWSPAADQLATATEDGVTQLWDIESGQEVLRAPASFEVTGLRWSPDRSNLLAIATDAAKFWRMDFGLLLDLVRREQDTKPLAESDLASYGLERGLMINPTTILKISDREKEGQLVAWSRYFASKARNSLDWPSTQMYLDYSLRLFERADTLSSINWYYEERAANHTYYAYEWLKQGNTAEANAQLKQAFLLRPDYPDAWLLSGLSKWMEGNKRQALQQIMDASTENTSYDLINVLLLITAAGQSVPDIAELYHFITYDNPSATILDQLGLSDTPVQPAQMEQLMLLLKPEAQSRYRIGYLLAKASKEPSTEGACDLLLQALQAIKRQQPSPPDLWQSFNQIFWTRARDIDATTAEQSDIKSYRLFFPLIDAMDAQMVGSANWLELARLVFQWKSRLAAGQQFEEAIEMGEILDKILDGLVSVDASYMQSKRLNQLEQAWFTLLTGDTLTARRLLNPLLDEANEPEVVSQAKIKQAHLMLVQGDTQGALDIYRQVIKSLDQSLQATMMDDLMLLGERAAATREKLFAWSEAVSTAQTNYDNAISSRQSYYERAEAGDYATTVQQLDITLEAWQNLEKTCADLTEIDLEPDFCSLLAGEIGVERGNRSFYLIFLQRYAEAVSTAQAGFQGTGLQWIRVNESHGYLYAGRWSEAKAIYTAIKDLPNELDETISLGEALLADFVVLRDSGIWHKDVPKAAAFLLGRKLNAEEKQTYGREIPEEQE